MIPGFIGEQEEGFAVQCNMARNKRLRILFPSLRKSMRAGEASYPEPGVFPGYAN
jgi:hypothetical protein